MAIPEWVSTALIGFASAIVGYWLRGQVDEHFAQRKETRQFKHSDVRALRDDLLIFLGEPRAHFAWLQNVRDVRSAGGIPSPDEKARLIAEWVYKNAPRYPKERRGPMNLIANVTYQLAAGNRHFLDVNPLGEEAVHDAWELLDDYSQELTRELHGTATKEKGRTILLPHWRSNKPSK
jgi:hypothetical protein